MIDSLKSVGEEPGTFSHVRDVRVDRQVGLRGGATSVRPEVHGEVLAATTCHMIS